MHELGIVIQIVKQMEHYMDDNDIKRIDTLVLGVGELSGVVPKYLRDVYPIAVEKSRLCNTKLELEITPGIGQCKHCGFNYNLVQNDNNCPKCGTNDFKIITGKDFLIQRIHAE
jgi:hydrogenase nickel incorporation protein HypA/HybF